MYLSRLIIDVGKNPDRPRPGRLWLRNRYHVHQRLCMAFPSQAQKDGDPDFLKPYKPEAFGEYQVHVKRDNESGFLFHIDPPKNGLAKIIVQSAIEPFWEYAFYNANYLLGRPPEVKPFEPLFAKGQCLRFRIEANPTRRLSRHSPDAKEESIGKRVPIPAHQLCNWVARKGEDGGFSIVRDTLSIQSGYIYVKKTQAENGHRLRSVRYDGILEVIDPDRFRDTLICGIGSGKAFGFGLFLIAAVNSEYSGKAI